MLVNFIDCTEKHHKDLGKIVKYLAKYFAKEGIETKHIKLQELRVSTCTDCRCCTQKKSKKPVKCVLKDDLNDVLDDIEEADAYVILADRNNLFEKNKVHEKFSKRLIAYKYWPFTQKAAVLRRNKMKKTSILINYNTTKYYLNHSFVTSRMYMEYTSNTIGAKVLDWEAITPKKKIKEEYKDRLKEMASKLVKSLKKAS